MGQVDESAVLAQRAAALQKANEVRTARAELKRRIKKGEVDPRELFAQPPPELGTMKIADLLPAVPKIGRVKAQKIIKRNKIRRDLTFRHASSFTRGEIARMLP